MNYISSITDFVESNKLGFATINSIEVSKLGMGENNVNYLAIVNRERFVFRIASTDFAERNMSKEFQTLQALPVGIAPKAILFDSSKKIIPKSFMIQSFIKGKPLRNWSDKQLVKHAKEIAKIHSIREDSSTYFGNEFSIHKRLLRELDNYEDDGIYLGNTPELEVLIEKILHLFERSNPLFNSMNVFSRIHGDLTLGNIFSHNGILHYLDWELSRVDDNAFDIAKLYYTDMKLLDWSLHLNGVREDLFLDTYKDNLSFDDPTLKQRVHLWQIYILFTDYLYFVWKVNNYDATTSDIPKLYYEKTCALMKQSLKKRFR